MRSSVVDRLTRIPEEDRAALRKMWGSDIPQNLDLGNAPAIVVVDMTAAFVEDQYPTGWSATGEPCADAVSGLLESARASGMPVFYTVTEPLNHRAQVGEWLRGKPGPSMFPFDSPGPHHEIVHQLKPHEADIMFAKPKPSAFYGTQFAGMLTALRVDTLIVTGMTTSGCVRATVNDAFMLNYRVIVPIDGVADRSQLSHEVELFDMGAKYADLTETAELIDLLSK